MKILFINTTEHTGGASIACCRLMHALVARGHEVRLVVRDDKRLINRLRFIWERLCLLPHIPYSRVFSIDDGRCGTDISATADFEWADAIHLHWVNQAMLGTADLSRLIRRCHETGKRLVWTMHDIWPATGICHLPGDCQHWQTGCGNCPMLRHPGQNDLSARIYQKKAEAYSHGQITFVTCSHFLGETAQKSALLQRQRVVTIPNPLDTEFFSPGATRRAALGLPTDKLLLLFVAYNVLDDNKGLSLIEQGITRFIQDNPSMKDRIAFIPVGKNATQAAERFACEAIPFEYVSDADTMRDLYRAADVLLVASKMENLPNTIAEAKACGTPVIASAVGGIPEMIHHGRDGYLTASPAEDAERCINDMAEGLRYILLHPNREAISLSAREDAVAQFSEASVAARYEAIY